MGTDEVRLDWKDFEQKIVRRIATASSSVEEIGAQQFRGIIRTVVKVTPPMHDQGAGDGLTTFSEGRAAGRSKVASDIRKLYGTPGDAFDLLKEKAGMQKAREFHALYKHNKIERASDLLRPYSSGAGLYPFDAGAVHQRFRNKRGTVGNRREKKVFYVSDPRELAAYIRSKQENVMYLVSGWKRICEELGISLPDIITRHNGPGDGSVTVSDSGVRFYASNDVPYARAADVVNRIQFAIDVQTARMQRQWEHFMKVDFWKDFGSHLALAA